MLNTKAKEITIDANCRVNGIVCTGETGDIQLLPLGDPVTGSPAGASAAAGK